ncbi:MAG: helix-turn-helix transcriptional regulator [Clostridia bacterium]|nr:helix-turn-helix transcriptional regulator [Clostridia bacterium]
MNVCKFVKNSNPDGEINIINFVYETERFGNAIPFTLYCYRLCLVTEGSGTLLYSGKREPLLPGDVFFTFPKISFTLEGDEDFKYIYISYNGDRAAAINKKLAISPERSVFRCLDELIPLWKNGLNAEESMTGYAGEGILFYTLSLLGTSQENGTLSGSDNPVKKLRQVKKYLDDNFCDCELSLDSISELFFYNKKYLSSAFKRQYGTGIKEYITALRINRALYLIEHNYTTVKTIASMCGFKDQLYFSKVFSKNIGMTPKEYIKSNNPLVSDDNTNT